MIEKKVFIAIEGPIGVGKTTLATLLSNHFNSHLIREIVEENPFLADFYTNIDEYALQTEAFFFFNRIKQLQDIDSSFEEHNVIVSDYHIIKNLIFAGITLSTKDFHQYKQVYNIFVPDLPQPDIIIYLHSNLDILMNRISIRDRSFERKMDANYIQTLSKEYEYYFNPISIKHHFAGQLPQVISIDTSNRDFLNNPEDRNYIINEINSAIKLIK